MKKRWITMAALAAMLAFAVGLFGCGDKGGEEADAAGSGASAEAEGGTETEEPVYSNTVTTEVEPADEAAAASEAAPADEAAAADDAAADEAAAAGEPTAAVTNEAEDQATDAAE
ncbi:MAG: hypothetical protein LBR44_12015 [Clostridiales Family XIII bacterium]|jgi:hypothetical protein|nr:hypothetical protein [Clostridiales Family XIII bacterium]